MLRRWSFPALRACATRSVFLLSLAGSAVGQEPAPPGDDRTPPGDAAPAPDLTVHLEAPPPVAIDSAPVEPALSELPSTEASCAEGGEDELSSEEPVPVDLPWEAGPTDVATTEALPPPDERPAEDAPGLDEDVLRRLAGTEPGSLGPLSMGTPDGGLLFNPVPFPEGDLWTVREPAESFATAETIVFITTAIETVESRFPGSPRLVIGDISRPDGGRLDRHRSHQAGRDADIGFYFTTGEAATLRKPGKRDLDVSRTWALVRALVTETDIERIFVDRQIQRRLYEQAAGEGEDRAWLDDIFGRRTAGKDAIIQHERRHQDHLHARFYNPEAQERGRLVYPVLVESGLVPGPTLKHRVRSGETLSHLARRYGTSAAKIRAANGLRGSALRAGRTYAIPVRKMPDLSRPVVVPPRRLPPADPAADRAAFVGLPQP